MFDHAEPAPRLSFEGVQREAVAKSIQQLQIHGGVLSVATGVGKTVMALCVACTMKTKTLIVVHKQFLMDQWDERIKTFVPGARVGRVHQSTEDVEDCDVVVGMLQSIAMRDYDEDTFRGFGLVIFDECHVVHAPVFSRALRVLCAPHMLGLSATPVRRDGLSRVIHWFLGPTFFEHSLTGKGDVIVSVCHYRPGRTLPTNMVAATTILCNMQDRNEQYRRTVPRRPQDHGAQRPARALREPQVHAEKGRSRRGTVLGRHEELRTGTVGEQRRAVRHVRARQGGTGHTVAGRPGLTSCRHAGACCTEKRAWLPSSSTSWTSGK